MRLFVCLMLGLLAGSRAYGMTAEGTLITNLASGTFTTTAGTANTISYGVTATVVVAQPMVMLQKTAAPTLQSVAGTVTFCITFSNASRYASAFSVQVFDLLPTNMRFIDWGTPGNWVDDPTGITQDYWNGGTASWQMGQPPAGSANATSAFRWNVPVLGPGRSGYVCYRASVM